MQLASREKTPCTLRTMSKKRKAVEIEILRPSRCRSRRSRHRPIPHIFVVVIPTTTWINSPPPTTMTLVLPSLTALALPTDHIFAAHNLLYSYLYVIPARDFPDRSGHPHALRH